jgi:ribonuclease P protein component
MGETTVPAEQPAASQASRVPAPHVHARRPGDPEGPPGQGPGPALGLTWRVRGQATFRRLRDVPRVRRGPLTVAWLADAEDAPPRVAFAVGRRVGGAVARNRLRRRLRAVARSAALPAGAWLIGAGPDASVASAEELSAWLRDAVESLARPA